MFFMSIYIVLCIRKTQEQFHFGTLLEYILNKRVSTKLDRMFCKYSQCFLEVLYGY